MKNLLNRRVLGLATLLLGTQLLSACIVLPVPAYRPRAGVVVDVEPGYRGYGHRHHERDHDRDWRH